MRIDEMTSEDFREAVIKGATVILPLGATEAHGPHLPLGTDTFQPEYVAERVAEMNDNVLVAPVMPYGQHSSMRNVAGTIGISFDTLRAFVTDVLNYLIADGIRRIVIISGHAGTSHMCAITEACRAVVGRRDVRIAFFSDYDIASEMTNVENDGHGGLVETSRILDIRPDLVRGARPVGTYKSHGHLVLRDGSVCFPEGMAGDTRDSTPEFGKEINDYVVRAVSEIIREDLS
ncbi:MAG: creatininase family protein [Thermoplasmatales archaeon]|jgi:creatinine amidohydrolase|nr:creatininase family protein [Thermoplasmatales archaeon]